MTIGQHLAPELADVERRLRGSTLTYSFERTTDLLAAWEIAREQRMTRALQPAAIVWLQSRPGEFPRGEVDEVRKASPAARHIVVTGCLCEGELRSGQPLREVVRLSWNLGPAAILAQIQSLGPLPTASTPHWLAIHAPDFLTYEGLAWLCESLGHKAIWQPAHLPAVSSEPAIRLFANWQSWENWHGRRGSQGANPAAEILLLDFPRPADFERAADSGITRVLPLPPQLAELQAALANHRERAAPSATPSIGLRLAS